MVNDKNKSDMQLICSIFNKKAKTSLHEIISKLKSSDQAGLHDLLEPNPVVFKILIAFPGGQIQHLTET